MSETKLASVQKIIDIVPIEGADKIELAKILGWQVVVKKEEFKIGDLVCYIQIDTVMPELPEYEFLRERKFRIKSIKLRGQISQGLIVPIPKGKNYKEGKDVTRELGVMKYEKPDNNPVITEKKPKSGWKKWSYLFRYNILYKIFPGLKEKNRSSFPKHLVPITDEERLQNIPQVLDQFMGKMFYVSYKLDGSSITIIHNRVLGISKFRICSRRFELHDKNNDWSKVFNETCFHKHILKLVKHFKTDNIIVQGEAIGKFNGNHHGLKKDEIRLFNIYVDGKRIDPLTFNTVVKSLDIPHCPFFGMYTLNYSMPEMLYKANIPDVINPKVPAEGLVWRDIEGKISFKVINNEYLLKKGE